MRINAALRIGQLYVFREIGLFRETQRVHSGLSDW